MQSILGTNSLLGLLTLILLEVVLGVDNLIFITLLAGKLPTDMARRASFIGLSFALLTRIALLFVLGWAASLTKPLFTIFGVGFAARNIILLFGGMFLLAKSTIELHERIEGDTAAEDVQVSRSTMWHVIAQIVILDAIFSLDSIITAIGMVHDIKIMIIAVVVAMAIMMLAARKLLIFLQKHQTVVILCLGFLMMIGFSLVVEAFNIEISKGYLYAAIAFSVAIEAINQFSERNKKRYIKTNDLRRNLANSVLRVLSGDKGDGISNLETVVDVLSEQSNNGELFKPTERAMIKGVLDLADRPVRSIMTPRNEVEWLDLSQTDKQLHQAIKNFTHSRIIVARKMVDEFVGVAMVKDLYSFLLTNKKISWKKFMRQPIVVPDSTDVISLMEKMRKVPVQMAIVVDEHGSFEGVVTPTDIFEAISGDFICEENENADIEIIDAEKGDWLVDASVDIRYLSSVLEQDLLDESDKYSTLAGYLLWQFGHIPIKGEVIVNKGLRYEIVDMMDKRNISRVRITKLQSYVRDEKL